MLLNILIILVSILVIISSMFILSYYGVDSKSSIIIRWFQFSSVMLVIFLIILPTSNNSELTIK